MYTGFRYSPCGKCSIDDSDYTNGDSTDKYAKLIAFIFPQMMMIERRKSEID